MISVTEAHRGAQQIAAAAEQAGSATTEFGSSSEAAGSRRGRPRCCHRGNRLAGRRDAEAQWLERARPSRVETSVQKRPRPGRSRTAGLRCFKSATTILPSRSAPWRRLSARPRWLICHWRPTACSGLANLRGVVLPVLSISRLLDLPANTVDETSRVIVTEGAAPVGFVVDRMIGLLDIPAERIDKDTAGAGLADLRFSMASSKEPAANRH